MPLFFSYPRKNAGVSTSPPPSEQRLAEKLHQLSVPFTPCHQTPELTLQPAHPCCQIVEVISLCGSGCQMTLEGTEMKLDESGDVTWILPDGEENNET